MRRTISPYNSLQQFRKWTIKRGNGSLKRTIAENHPINKLIGKNKPHKFSSFLEQGVRNSMNDCQLVGNLSPATSKHDIELTWVTSTHKAPLPPKGKGVPQTVTHKMLKDASNNSLFTPSGTELVVPVKANYPMSEEKENVFVVPMARATILGTKSKLSSLSSSKSMQYLTWYGMSGQKTPLRISNYQILNKQIPIQKLKFAYVRADNGFDDTVTVNLEVDRATELSIERRPHSWFEKRLKTNLSDYWSSFESFDEDIQVVENSQKSEQFDVIEIEKTTPFQSNATKLELSPGEGDVTVRVEDEIFDLEDKQRKLWTLNYNQMTDINKFNRTSGCRLKSRPRASQIHKELEPYLKVFLQKKPISDYSDFPMYFGYYFRESYRNAVDDLIKSGMAESSKMVGLLDDPQTFVIEDEIFLPNLSESQKDQQLKHVVASLQNIHYLNSWEIGHNSYKSLKVRVPKRKSKLLVLDMDETLIHAIPDTKENIDPKLKEEAHVQLDFVHGDVSKLFVNIRPYMLEWVHKLKEMYQIVIFTASIK